MPKLSSFATPANWLDFGAGDPNQALLNAAWSANINRWTQVAIVGNPWSNQNDSPRPFYFNPLVTDVPANTPTLLITWNAFPGRLAAYFTGNFPGFPPSGTPSTTTLQQWADTGDIPKMPTSVCLNDNTPTAYTPTGPRGWQDEYCEWSVTRNAAGKITKVMFTCENPEYWYTLWAISPAKVLSLYQALVNPAVILDDLCLKGPDGKAIKDPTTNNFAYNPLNKWNYGTVSAPTSGGAVHLTSSPNTLGAEIFLGAAATILRQNSNGPVTDASNLICCSQYGRPLRNSDPHIGYSVNDTVNISPAVQATLSDPVGLYIQDPDFSGYALPLNVSVPAGTTPASFWKVVRGSAGGRTLHATYEVPAGLNFTVGDITINGEAIQYGSQITATFRIGLSAMAIPATQSTNPLVNCVQAAPSPTPSVTALQPMVVYLASRAVEAAANELMFSLPILALAIPAGGTIKDVAMYCSAADAGTTANCPEKGVSIKITNVQQVDTSGDYLMTVDLSADAGAAPGDRTIQLQRGGDKVSGAPTPGLLTVILASSATRLAATSGVPKRRAHRFSRT